MFSYCSEPFKAFALVAPVVRAFKNDCFIELPYVIAHRDYEMGAYIFFVLCLAIWGVGGWGKGWIKAWNILFFLLFVYVCVCVCFPACIASCSLFLSFLVRICYVNLMEGSKHEGAFGVVVIMAIWKYLRLWPFREVRCLFYWIILVTVITPLSFRRCCSNRNSNGNISISVLPHSSKW